jgi:D-glycero-alpha-D-manno-heptose-7-phosphate kinase
MPTVVARAPGRVSLAGGGTDIPAYYERHGGAVASLAIRRYAFAEISERSGGLELASLDHDVRERIAVEKYERRMRFPFLAQDFVTLPKAVAWHFQLQRARVAVSSDLPAGGGLGSSAAVTVALITAAAAFVGTARGRGEVAELAARVEMSLLRRPCGKQDPYVSAFGGAMLYELARDGSVTALPIRLQPESKADLERHLLLFSSSSRRSAAGPLAELRRRCRAGDRQTLRALGELKDLAYHVRGALERGDITGLARLIEAGWQAKRNTHALVSTPEIDRGIAIAKDAGALAARLCGAGGAGPLLVLCKPERHRDVREALATQGWRGEPLILDDEGGTLCEPVEREASV